MNNIKDKLWLKIRVLKLNYYCAMYWLFKMLRSQNKRTTYYAKIIVNAIDMKIIGNGTESSTEFDL